MHENVLFWLLLCGHLAGDFYAQPQGLAERKRKKVRFLLLHCLIYSFSVLMFLLPVMNRDILIVFVWISISHCIIDFAKIKLYNFEKWILFIERYLFFIDQIAHIAIIIVLAYLYAINDVTALNGFGSIVLDIYENFQINIIPSVFIHFIFVFLMIGKPANILINEINKNSNSRTATLPDNETMKEEQNIASYQDAPAYQNTGKMIGILERMIIIMMLVLQQYAAIGLVFAAKSISRYDKIAKDSSFAEYYLVGTLLSLLICIFCILLIQPI